MSTKIKITILFFISVAIISLIYLKNLGLNPELLKDNPIETQADKHIVIINAGSSGTRAHVYQINKDMTLKELLPAIIKQPGISSFINNKKELITYTDNLISDIKKTINLSKSCNNTPVYLMATAGMRYVEEQNPEQAVYIYNTIRGRFNKDNTLDLKYIGTIDGRKEGLYDWITVNFLLNNSYDFNKGYLALDMGGASTQVVYKDNDNKQSKYHYSLKLNNNTHNLFIHSFLGLGYNQSIEYLKTQSECSSKYNLQNCAVAAQKYIEKFNVQETTGSLNQYNIIAFDHIYELYDYFRITDANYPIKSLNQALALECQSDTFNKTKHCLGGIYIINLLTYGYGLSENTNNNKLQILKNINNTELDWSLGAAIHKIVSLP